MTIRILVNGASGKMGRETVQTIQQDPELELVGQLGREDNLAFSIQQTRPQVVVDFTTASDVYKNATTIITAGVHPVIGTTGLQADQIATLKKLCAEKKLGGIIAPNFSIAVLLMMRFAREAAHYYPHVEIIEMHHAAKEDSPSGTALKTADVIAETREKISIKPSRETIPGARGAESQKIPIHAVRLPGLLACQEVIFGGPGETLSLRHQSIHRECFMPGVRLACKKVMTLDTLVYGLETLL